MNEDYLICSKCNSKNDSNNLFCYNCGNSLKEENIQLVKNDSSTDNRFKSNCNYSAKNYNENELSLFLEKNQAYYIEKFNLIDTTGNKKAWNWCPFLFGVYWMFYRKMYIEGILYLLANIVFAFIPFIGFIFNIALLICAGLFANSFYFDHIKKAFDEISCVDNSMRSTLISKKGGTNIVLPIILIIVPIIIGIIISVFISAAIGSMLYYY